MDLERLTEALEWHDSVDGKCPLPVEAHVLIDAARAYRDFLADFPTDEDVEVVTEVFEDAGHQAPFAEGYARAALRAVADARRTEEESE